MSDSISIKPMRQYKCLRKQEYTNGSFKLVALRDEDRYEILEWRNSQLEILRQKSLISHSEQEKYFAEVVNKLFAEDHPQQLLFSFLQDDKLIGYGGLVHIDWESKNAEISFLTSLERSAEQKIFESDWNNYLDILKEIACELDFVKVYTYAYSIRKNLFSILENKGFLKEAELKKHICINGNFENVIIHSFFLK